MTTQPYLTLSLNVFWLDIVSWRVIGPLFPAAEDAARVKAGNRLQQSKYNFAFKQKYFSCVLNKSWFLNGLQLFETSKL